MPLRVMGQQCLELGSWETEIGPRGPSLRRLGEQPGLCQLPDVDIWLLAMYLLVNTPTGPSAVLPPAEPLLAMISRVPGTQLFFLCSKCIRLHHHPYLGSLFLLTFAL